MSPDACDVVYFNRRWILCSPAIAQASSFFATLGAPNTDSADHVITDLQRHAANTHSLCESPRHAGEAREHRRCWLKHQPYPESFSAFDARLVRMFWVASIRSSSAAGTGRECR